MPLPETVSLRPLRRPDAPAVQQLWDDRFGGDPSTQKNWMEAALNPTHSTVGLVAVAASDDELVGLSFLDVGDRAYTRQYLGLDVLDLHLPLADANGIFHLSCVHADWEGRGIGSAFYERRLEVLANRDIDRAFGIAWHRPRHPVDSRLLFKKFGFTCLVTVDEYYLNTDPRPNCPQCSGPCTCAASLYARDLAPPFDNLGTHPYN